MEIYPKDYDGVFSIAYDAIALAKEGANKLSDLYFESFPDEIMLPIAKGIREMEDSISEMQKMQPAQNDEKWIERKALAR